MAYDPTKPANNSPISSVELRSQFAGLKTLIDDLPASQPMTDVITANAAGPLTGVPPPNLTVSDPPTQAEVQAVIDFLNQMYVPLSRT
jgi:hypothetical protein